MAVWYHPENKPFRLWELQVVRADEKKIVRKEIVDKGTLGHYKRLLEVSGSQIGGTIDITSGWFNIEGGDWIDPVSRIVVQPVIQSHIIFPERPIIHFGSEWPTFSMSLLGLLNDSLRK